MVDGGDDVVSFRAELKLNVVYRKCPLTARVRLGIALSGFLNLTSSPSHLRAEKTVGKQFNTGREHTIAITTIHGTIVETNAKGWCIDTSQTVNETRDENETGECKIERVKERRIELLKK